MPKNLLPGCPIAIAEVKFIEQYIFESMHLFAVERTPASHWLRENKLGSVEDIAPFGLASQEHPEMTPLSEILENLAKPLPVSDLVIPWSNREEFLQRKDQITAWLNRRNQSRR